MVGKLKTEGGASLNAGIALSLECLEAKFSEYVDEHSVKTDHTVSDLYVSLCVVSDQAWVPVSVLSRMWQLEEDAAEDIAKLFCDMSLAKLELHSLSNESDGVPGIVVHDLLLDFCRRQAEAGKQGRSWDIGMGSC